jgi:hypothetical protein
MSLMKKFKEAKAILIEEQTEATKFDLLAEIATSIPISFHRESLFARSIMEGDNADDSIDVTSKVKRAVDLSKKHEDTTGFALELDNGGIIKVFIKKDQAADFESRLTQELETNSSEEHDHRQAAEILYDMKDDFDIVDIKWDSEITEDEEEEGKDTDDELSGEDDKELGIDDKDGDKEDSPEDEMEPDLEPAEPAEPPESSEGLMALINAMGQDAEARKLDAQARIKDAEAKILSIQTQAEEGSLDKAEKLAHIEAKEKATKDAEKEQAKLVKLAQYDQDKAPVEPSAEIETPDAEPVEPSEENEEQSIFKLATALKSMLGKK